jgi:hypothetical protein
MRTNLILLFTSLLASSNLWAADIEATLYPGQTTNTSSTVILPSLPPAADVLFSFDVTSSMGGVIDTAKSNAITLMNNLEATGVSFHFGVSSFGDYPATYNSCGYNSTYGTNGFFGMPSDYPYRLDQTMTTNLTAVTAAISSLELTPGMDGPEAYTRVLYESYADPKVNWRDGAARIMVNFGDSVPHDCDINRGIPGAGTTTVSTGGDPGRDGIMGTADDLVLLDVLGGMASNHVTLLAARVSSYIFEDYYFPYWTNWTAITGGKAFQSTNTSLIRDLMQEITNSLTISCVGSLQLTVQPSTFNSWLTATPPGFGRTCSGDIRVFNLAFTPPGGTPKGDYSFTLHVADDQGVEYLVQSVLIHVLAPVPLAVALNNSSVPWTTATNLPWFGQTAVSHDGAASGRSYFLKDGQQCTLTTTTNGPGTLSFWWKVSSQTNADVLRFLSYSGGTTNLTAQISGESGWQQVSVLLPGGPQTLAWTYSKDASQSAGLDAGFVDQVTYTYGATLPFIISDPVSQTTSGETPVTFAVQANGTPVLAYQWRHNGMDIPGATSNAFRLPTPAATDAGCYSVRVYSPYGETNSGNASLTFIPLVLRGDNSQGQSALPGDATNLVAIAAGAWHSLGLCVNGTIRAWGDDDAGQCAVPSLLTNALAIAAGGYHSLAIQADGAVVAWGADDSGQSDVPKGLGPMIGIAAGAWHSLALLRDGSVRAWGDNTWGQSSIPAGLNNVVAIAAAGNHSLALRSNGTVVAWGDNTDAEGLTAGQSIVPAGLSGVVAIGAGEYHSLAVRSDGTVVAWGDNSEGQTSVPSGLGNVVAVAGGGGHSLALRANGTVASWGRNWSGQCNLLSSLANVVGLAGGEQHSLLLITSSLPTAMLLKPIRASASFSFLIQTLNRKHYALEFADSLAGNSWAPICTNAGNGALELLTDRAATTAQRFYRLNER